MSDSILLIGSIDCSTDNPAITLLEMSLGVVDRKADEFGGPSVDVARLGAIDESGLVDCWFTLLIRGSSVDETQSVVTMINDELRLLPDITFGIGGSAYAATIKPVLCKSIEVPLGKEEAAALVNMYWTKIMVVMRRDPFLYGSEQTIISDSTTSTPAVVSLEDQLGNVQTPLDIIADGNALDLSSLWIGWTTDTDTTISDYVTEAIDLTWDAGEGWTDSVGYPAAPTELVLDGTPDGSTWPTTWTRSDAGTHVHADSSKFHIEDDTTPHDSYMESTSYITAVAGTVYVARAQIEIINIDIVLPDGGFTAQVNWYTSGNALISSDTIAFLQATGAETLYEVSVTAPATTAKAKLKLFWNDCDNTSDATARYISLKAANCWRHTGMATAPMPISSDLAPGEYLVLAKGKSLDPSDPGTIGHMYSPAPVTITSEVGQWFSLGVVTLPTRALRGASTDTLSIIIVGAGTGDEVYINAIALLPVSFGGMVGWHLPISAGAVVGSVNVVAIEDDCIFADDVGDLANSSFGGRRIRASGGSLVVIAEQALSSPTTSIDLTVSAVPRYEQLPSL